MTASTAAARVQSPGGRKTGDVFWRDGRIVDDDAGGLAAGLGGMGRDIVDLGSRQLCDGGDIVQKCEKATHLIGHSRACLDLNSGTMLPPRRRRNRARPWL